MHTDNIYVHTVSTRHPGRVATVERNTGLAAVVRGSVVKLEPKTCREQAKALLSQYSNDNGPKGAA